MKIEFEMAKLNPTTKVSLNLVPGQIAETDKGFIIPIILPTSDGKQIPVSAIECKLLDVENGVQRIAVSAIQCVDGELGEATLLNNVLIDLKQFVLPTDENEIVLTALTTPAPKTKAS